MFVSCVNTDMISWISLGIFCTGRGINMREHISLYNVAVQMFKTEEGKSVEGDVSKSGENMGKKSRNAGN